MTELTALDRAHAAMQAAPEDPAPRLAFYARLAETTLLLLLEAEPRGEAIEPVIAQTEQGRFALAFDTEERLADFTGAPATYVALPGRVLAGLLGPQELGLGVNLDAAPSAILLPPEAMGWLADALGREPAAVAEEIVAVRAPEPLPPALEAALGARLAGLGGMVRGALLARARHSDGREEQVLAFLDAAPHAQAALARMVAETLTFSGAGEAALDVAFLSGDDPRAQQFAEVGQRFEIAAPEAPAPAPVRAAPGSDPDRPPILRRPEPRA